MNEMWTEKALRVRKWKHLAEQQTNGKNTQTLHPSNNTAQSGLGVMKFGRVSRTDWDAMASTRASSFALSCMQLKSNQSAAIFKTHLSAAADALLLRDSVKMGFRVRVCLLLLPVWLHKIRSIFAAMMRDLLTQAASHLKWFGISIRTYFRHPPLQQVSNRKKKHWFF